MWVSTKEEVSESKCSIQFIVSIKFCLFVFFIFCYIRVSQKDTMVPFLPMDKQAVENLLLCKESLIQLHKEVSYQGKKGI